jgi:hypothetical protein
MSTFRTRLGFREFVLLVTLASLVAASFALRARVGNQYSAISHANRAHTARAEREQWLGQISLTRQLLEREPSGTANRTRLEAYVKHLEASVLEAEERAETHAGLARDYGMVGW